MVARLVGVDSVLDDPPLVMQANVTTLLFRFDPEPLTAQGASSLELAWRHVNNSFERAIESLLQNPQFRQAAEANSPAVEMLATVTAPATPDESRKRYRPATWRCTN
jgi:hypothetical protein